MNKYYINIYSHDFDSIYYRAYDKLEKAEKDECYSEDLLFDGSFSLEEFPQVNKGLKLWIATMLICNEIRKHNLALRPFTILNCDFDGENVSDTLDRLIMQNYNIDFGEWKVN